MLVSRCQKNECSCSKESIMQLNHDKQLYYHDVEKNQVFYSSLAQSQQKCIRESMQHTQQQYKHLFLDLMSACGCNPLYQHQSCEVIQTTKPHSKCLTGRQCTWLCGCSIVCSKCQLIIFTPHYKHSCDVKSRKRHFCVCCTLLQMHSFLRHRYNGIVKCAIIIVTP